MERDQYGGYTFTDDDGVKADYAPGAVLSVTRAEPAAPVTEVHVHVDGKATAAEREKAAPLTRRNNIGNLQVK